jgi:heavy metal translocating P-type ATPase
LNKSAWPGRAEQDDGPSRFEVSTIAVIAPPAAESKDLPARVVVKHRLPGRFRIAVERRGPPDPAYWTNLTHSLSTLESVESVQLNGITGSLVVTYRGRQATVERHVLACIKAGPRATARTSVAVGAGGKVGEAAGRSALRSLQIATLAIPLSYFSFASPLFWACILYSAWPGLQRAAEVLRREHRLNVDFQDAVSIALSMLSRQNAAAAITTWLIALGDTIRERTALRSRRAVQGMLKFQDSLCWVERQGRKVRMAVSEVKTGDCVVVYPGQMIPVDGTVLKGTAAVDQKAITGEALGVTKERQATVFAGTVVQNGQLYIKTVRHGDATVIARIVRAVQAAPLGETRAQNYAEKVADRLVAPNLLVSGALFSLSSNVERFLSMLIVDYGTGIRVAAPTAVLTSMTDAARRGIVFKSGAVIENLSRVDTIVFDKTGTVTRGEPAVGAVICYAARAFSRRRLIALAASAEARLHHPASHAIAKLAKQERIKPMRRQSCKFEIGLGVHARVDDHDVLIGSSKFLASHGVDLQPAASDLGRCDERGHARLLVAVGGRLAGLLVLEDEVRPEMQAVVDQLRHRGLRHITMLTGDNAEVAAQVARKIGLSEFIADVMPEEKADVIRKMQAAGRKVAMIGDGVNDSVALALADVGIAMGHGADIARQAADVVLLEDHMTKLVGAIDISRQAARLIKQNILIVGGLNTLALGLSIPPRLVSPATTAVISNGSAILASLNSMRPVLGY